LNFWSRVLKDVKPAFDPVGHIDQTIGVDIKVVEHGRLLSFRGRWNEKAHFLRTKFISDIEDPKAGIIISHEDNILALERTGAIFVNVVRAES
jgi:hypothetical protein